MSEQTFGEWLAAELESRRWTPAQLARKRQLSSMNTVLQDRCEPSCLVRVRLARGLGLPEATVHQHFQETWPIANTRARAEKLAKVSQDFCTLLDTAPASRSRWQEQWFPEEFIRLPAEARAMVPVNIADLPTLRENFLLQLNTLLHDAQECPA